MSDKYEAVRNIPLRDVLAMCGYSGWKQRRGKKEWTMKCPFHQPKKNNTAFSFTDEKFNCFSCGEHGSGAIDLLMRLKKLNFQSAVEFLGQERPTSQQRHDNSRPHQNTEREENVLENKPFAGSYEKYYVKSDWLKARGLTEETLKLFGVGQYFNPSRKSLYSNKVFFPIRRFKDGVKTAYLVRTIEENSSDPKYIFPKGFFKQLEVFGSWHLKVDAQQKGLTLPLRVGFLVESPLCVMKYFQMGLPAVSCFGAFVSEEQLDIISQVFRGLIYLPDRDKYEKVHQTIANMSAHLWVKAPALPESVSDPENLEREQILALLKS